jgi:hypothetical protein
VRLDVRLLPPLEARLVIVDEIDFLVVVGEGSGLDLCDLRNLPERSLVSLRLRENFRKLPCLMLKLLLLLRIGVVFFLGDFVLLVDLD